MRAKIIPLVILIMNISVLVLFSDNYNVSSNYNNIDSRTSEEDTREGYAILVGISDYPGSVNDLEYCHEDALSVRSMLINDCKFEEDKIILLQDSAASRDAINSAFDTVIAQIDSNDIFFFYFSGHGGASTEFVGTFSTSIDSPHPYSNYYDNSWSIYYPDAANIRVHFDRIELESNYDWVIVGDTDVSSGYYYYDYTGTYASGRWSGWVPVLSDQSVWIRMIADYSNTDWGISIDSYEVETYNGTHYLNSYDSLSTYNLSYFDHLLDSKLDAMSCAQKYVVSDSCHSGGMIPEVGDNNRFMITACDDAELSLEDSDRQQGLFTYYFLRAFDYATDSNNDGVISMEETFQYCESNTASRSTDLGYTFHPQEYDGISGESFLQLNYEDLLFNPVLTILIILIVIGVVVLGIFITGTVYNKKKNKNDRSGWAPRPKYSHPYQSVKPQHTISPSRPDQQTFSERILMKATIKDLILHGLPPPKSHLSPDAIKSLFLTKMVVKSISDGDSKASLNYMMSALKLGVPEPFNKQYRDILLKVLETDTMEASPDLITEKREDICTECGYQMEAHFKFCMKCGKLKVETQNRGLLKPEIGKKPQPQINLDVPQIYSIEDAPGLIEQPEENKCKWCGHQIETQDNFCNNCGKSQKDTPTENFSYMDKGTICSRCNSKVEIYQQVCFNCGALLKIQK